VDNADAGQLICYAKRTGRRNGAGSWNTPWNSDDPRRGETGVAWGFGSGGVEPNPLSGHGGCNRRVSSG